MLKRFTLPILFLLVLSLSSVAYAANWQIDDTFQIGPNWIQEGSPATTPSPTVTPQSVVVSRAFLSVLFMALGIFALIPIALVIIMIKDRDADVKQGAELFGTLIVLVIGMLVLFILAAALS